MQFLLSKNMRRLSRLYSQAVTDALPGLSLEHDADILLILASSNEAYPQKEIAEILQFDKSRVAILIEGLKQKGFIDTERNPADRRAHFVFLTNKGKQILPKIQEAIDQVNMMISRKLDDQQLDCVYQTLVQMQHNLTEHIRKPIY